MTICSDKITAKWMQEAGLFIYFAIYNIDKTEDNNIIDSKWHRKQFRHQQRKHNLRRNWYSICNSRKLSINIFSPINMNIQGLPNKIDHLDITINVYKPAVLCICKHKLIFIEINIINLNSYNLVDSF